MIIIENEGDIKKFLERGEAAATDEERAKILAEARNWIPKITIIPKGIGINPSEENHNNTEE